MVLGVQVALVLISEFSFFLQLKNRGSERSIDVDLRDVILAHIDVWTQGVAELLHLLGRVRLEKVDFVSELILGLRRARASHVRSHCPGLEATNAKGLHLGLLR